MLKQFFQKGKVEAGCDEAGRGSLAGPVYAAAVILPQKLPRALHTLDDSKKLTDRERRELRVVIEEEAIAWSVTSVTHTEIDSINILNASILAMNRAVGQLTIKPELLLIDGNRFNPETEIPYQCIIQGDGLYASIAAASILAKTYRDDFMQELHLQFPDFGWSQNKGYATPEHRSAILRLGYSSWHRKTFHIAEEQLMLEME
jgi:ribonuclease HII